MFGKNQSLLQDEFSGPPTHASFGFYSISNLKNKPKQTINKTITPKLTINYHTYQLIQVAF